MNHAVGQRCGENPAETSAIDFGPPATARAVEQHVAELVEDSRSLGVFEDMRHTLVVKPSGADLAESGVLIDVQHAALMAGVYASISVENLAGNAVQSKYPG